MILIKKSYKWESSTLQTQRIGNPLIAPLGAIPTDKKSGILSVRLFTHENQGFADASSFSAFIVNGFCIIFSLI